MNERVKANPFNMAYMADDPSNINDLIGTVTGLLFPMPVTEAQIDIFKEILNQGLPDFEWQVEWDKYVNNPEDENQKNIIEQKLKEFLIKATSMAEYQLI